MGRPISMLKESGLLRSIKNNGHGLLEPSSVSVALRSLHIANRNNDVKRPGGGTLVAKGVSTCSWFFILFSFFSCLFTSPFPLFWGHLIVLWLFDWIVTIWFGVCLVLWLFELVLWCVGVCVCVCVCGFCNVWACVRACVCVRKLLHLVNGLIIALSHVLRLLSSG